MNIKSTCITNKLNFFDEFECISADCKDTCCSGWDIYVDEATADFYMSDANELREKINKKMEKDEYGHRFILEEGKRCPFLNDNNLCELIIEKGEDYLCSICDEHPRYYNFYGKYEEKGLGLACEEVCRILLEKEEHIFMISEEVDEEVEIEEFEIEDTEKLLGIRADLIEIVKSPMSVSSKVSRLMERANYFNEQIFRYGEDYFLDDNEGEFLMNVLAAFKQTEAIDETWTKCLKEIYQCNKLSGESLDFSSVYSKHSRELDNILLYLIYRYFIKLSFDNDINIAMLFILFNFIFIVVLYALKDEEKLEDRIDFVKNWSKQIEYSEDNIEMMLEYIKTF